MAFHVHGRRETDPTDRPPSEYVMLLMPDAEVTRRMDGAGLVDFVEQAHDAVAEYVRSTRTPLEECQIACALLPGHRILVEVYVWPPPAIVVHAAPLTRALRRLPVPAASAPVAFSLRLRPIPSDNPRQFPPALVAFIGGGEATSLDDMLADVGSLELPLPSTSTFERIRARLAGGARTMPGDITHRTGLPVITTDDRIMCRAAPGFRVENEDPTTGFARVVHANGRRERADAETLVWLRSPSPQPSQAALTAMLDRTASVRVLAGGISRGTPVGDHVLLTIDGTGDLEELFETLEVIDGSSGHCMCLGDPTLELRGLDGARIAALGVHHGQGIRWSGWKDDARLLDGVRLLEWLDAHGVDGPLAAHREAERAGRARQAAWQRWQSRMPEPLRAWSPERWQAMVQRNDVRDALDALSSSHADDLDTIKALFDWFGAGHGPWTAFPSYEQLPELLLLAFPLDALVRAAEDPGLSDDGLEGAARLFAGHVMATGGSANHPPLSAMLVRDQAIFVPARKAQPLDVVPRTLLTRLRRYATRFDDEDKIARARSAFGEDA